MKSPCAIHTACTTATGKVVKRRFVPIQISVNSAGRLLNFQKKMPFDTAKIVGMLTVVNSPFETLDPLDPGIIQ